MAPPNRGSPPELPPSERLVWMLGACANNIVWGLQPVFTRWLQQRTRIPTMSLVFAVLGTSFCCNMAASVVSAPTPAPVDHPGAWRVAVAVALVYAARSSTNFLSASFTQAYTVAMIQMLGIFVMAGGSWLVLGEKVPNKMWLALTVSLAGSSMVVLGRETKSGGDGFTTQDMIGVAIQFGSLIFSTGARLQMRTSEGIFSPMQFMRFQYLGGGCVALAYSLFVTGPKAALTPWFSLRVEDWAIFFALSCLVHFVAATAQVEFNRKLGVATYATFQPLRLVGSAMGSALILGEPVKGVLTWAGLATVGLAVSAYAVYKQQLKTVPDVQREDIELEHSLLASTTED
eukprot:m.73654 g.73654  ORF g.73654 m.73654 type:complete len:345 (+) comp8854_c0_seq1:141-1175(+)